MANLALESRLLSHSQASCLLSPVVSKRQPSRRGVPCAVQAPPRPSKQEAPAGVLPHAPTGRQHAAGPKDAPLKSLFPPELPVPKQGDPKLKVAIVGCGLAGLSTAAELLDQGYEVDIYEARPFIGGKVASYKDRDGNHIELGLHVFFGCYHNLFRLMTKCGALDNLLLKDHTHTFVNEGGDVRGLDFRWFVGGKKIGAPFHGLKAFFTTPQLALFDKAANSLALGTSPVVRALFDPEGGMRSVRALDNVSFSDWFTSHGGSRQSIKRMWDPIAYALGFLDCDNISARCMLSIFQFFATKTDASVLRMLSGSPAERLLKPISEYVTQRGGRIHTRTGCREIQYEEGADGQLEVTGLKLGKGPHTEVVQADAYVAALDLPGAQRVIPPAWRSMQTFDDIYRLSGVPVVTVQLRYDGWVTEMRDDKARHQMGKAAGLDNLLYSGDAAFSCFADLALTSPDDYYREGEGSLMQCVLTPATDFLPMNNQQIADITHQQVLKLFPSAAGLKNTWHSIVKIGQSLYREAPGMDVFRPDQETPVRRFYMAGSFTKQDYIDSMEGATLSGRLCAAKVLAAAPQLARKA